jgi:hypothetical protein
MVRSGVDDHIGARILQRGPRTGVIRDIEIGAGIQNRVAACESVAEVAAELSVSAEDGDARHQREFSSSIVMRSQQDNALAGDFDALAAFQTRHDVIDANHVIASVLEAGGVIGVGPAGQSAFLSATNPADLEFGILPAHRTT